MLSIIRGRLRHCSSKKCTFVVLFHLHYYYLRLFINLLNILILSEYITESCSSRESFGRPVSWRKGSVPSHCLEPWPVWHDSMECGQTHPLCRRLVGNRTRLNGHRGQWVQARRPPAPAVFLTCGVIKSPRWKFHLHHLKHLCSPLSYTFQGFCSLGHGLAFLEGNCSSASSAVSGIFW